MKTKHAVWISLTGVYSYLFYQENIGFNLMIFTLLLIGGRLLIDRSKLKDRSWLITALGSIIAAFSVAYYGNELAVIANFVSLILLVGMDNNHQASVLTSFVNGGYTLITSPVFIVLDALKLKTSNSKLNSINRIALISIIPLAIVTLFFVLYRSSNAIFKELTDQIQFDWFSFGWLFFTVFGGCLIYGFYKANNIKGLAKFDAYEGYTIKPTTHQSVKVLNKEISIQDEYFSAILLLILLNGLIFFVNLGDFHFLFVSRELPKHVTFASYLHQGVGLLIVSILISIFILLFYFRGQLNFIEKSRKLKNWAVVWVIQNGLMLASVLVKNSMYIDTYGLTYKRIGVCIYVLLTAIGLFTTVLKIKQTKSSYYLIRLNGWSFFGVLILSATIHWDGIIMNENQSLKRDVDIHYLLELSDSIIPDLIQMEHRIKNQKEREKFHETLRSKMKYFLKEQHKISWKSANLIDLQVATDLKQLKHQYDDVKK